MERKRKMSIMVRLLLMVIPPCLLMGVLMTLYSGWNMQKGMQKTTLDGLRSTDYAVLEMFENVADGDYKQDAKGNVYRGEYKISDNNELADYIKNKTDVDVTFFYGDTRVLTSLKDKKTGDRLIGTTASKEVTDKVLKNGKEYSDTGIVINERPYYGYYVPVKNSDDSIVGMVFVGRESKDINAFIKSKSSAVFLMALIIMAMASIAAWITSRSVAVSVRGTEKVIGALADGNLTLDVEEKLLGRNDEIGDMARSVEKLRQELFEIISDIKKSSGILNASGESLSQMAENSSATTNEMSKVIEDLSKGAVSQAEEIEEASVHIGEMGQVIEEIVSNVDGLDHTSVKMKNASDESSVIIRQLSESNDRTTQAINRISRQIEATNDSVQMIHAAVELITSIASQTSLLALNASIEAARAGEHGKGFAVVASEIQKLAEQSNESAEKIKDIIRDLLSESEQTVNVMHEVEDIVAQQQEKLEETKTKFVSVADGVNASRSETEAIQSHTQVCDQSRARIIDAVQNLSAISQENAASTEQTTASMAGLNEAIHQLSVAAKELQGLSEDLEKDMSFFTI
ncbi:MAG: methyl-accepting chemotaxis protein [Lachnospiraceae bacterium]